MLVRADLLRIARGRIRDARALAAARRYAASMYLCGYAVELGLKARICRTLKWAAFPETPREFEAYTSFRTHRLDVLLRLSGRESAMKARHAAAWSVVTTWEPGARYRPLGKATAAEAARMMEATKVVLAAL